MVAPKESKTEPVRKKTVSKNTKKDTAKKVSTRKEENAVEDGHKLIPDTYINDLEDLAKALEANPALIDPIRDVFEYHLADPIDRKTFPRIVNAMSMFLGSKLTMVIVTGCHFNSPAFFEDLQFSTKDNEKVKGAIWVIQHLASIYGDRIQLAYTLSSGTIDEDWHSLDINTYKREGENPAWFIDMHIALYNGEEMKIKMTPNSAFQYIDILMKELTDNIPLDQVDPDLVEKCKEDFRAFRNTYYHEEEKEKNNDHPAGYA